MADRKARNKRRQRARNRPTTRAGQTGGRSLTRILGLTLGGIAVLAAIGGAVAFFGNASKDLPEAQAGEARSIPLASLDSSATGATIGTTVGKRIPDFDMLLNNGITVSTSGLIGEGKPTFLFFFATW